MSKIWKLFINENIKTWKKLSTKIMIIVAILAIIGTLGLVKIMQKTSGNVMIANDAVSCVALGTGKALDNLDALSGNRRI